MAFTFPQKQHSLIVIRAQEELRDAVDSQQGKRCWKTREGTLS